MILFLGCFYEGDMSLKSVRVWGRRRSSHKKIIDTSNLLIVTQGEDPK
jgi:hypothetical protein